MLYRVSPCAEFPNDNPSLHEGAIWICAEIGADISCELPVSRGARQEDVATDEDVELRETGVAEVEAEPAEEAGVIEVVEDFAFEDAFEEHGPVTSSEEETVEAAMAHDGPETTPGPDAFEAFAGVLEDVATASGADAPAVACLRALLGQSRLEGIVPEESTTDALVAGALVVRTDRGLVRAPAFTSLVVAWQGILRGESDDFGPCGAPTLDEWSANLVARVLGLASRSEGIRRELRRRGVAAFGFVADAA